MDQASTPQEACVVRTAFVDRGLGDIIEAICSSHAVTFEEIHGRGRTRRISQAREELWWQLRCHPGASFSYAEIGSFFDRNHTTVMSGVRAHMRRLRPSSSTSVAA